MDPLLSFVVLVPLLIGSVSGTPYILVIPLSISAFVCYLWAADKLVPSRLKSPPLSGYGLIPVYPSAAKGPASGGSDEQDRTVDVIFVHGLGSNPDTTWGGGGIPGGSREISTKSCGWITDLLPDDLKSEGLEKHVRLFTFNYNSYWMREANFTRLEEIGRNLRQELVDRKKTHLLLVGHSYGGLVIKQALRTESSEVTEAFKKHIVGIIFLGTPHRDSNAALLYPLKYDSEALLDLQTSFISQYGGTYSVYFYEKHKIRRYLFGFIPWLQEYVVNESSATDGAKDLDKVALETDHSGLNKFSRPDDNNYHLIKRRLVKVIRGSLKNADPKEPKSKQQECLRSLYFPEMELRQHDIETAAPNTCNWLITHPSYREWISRRQGLLWIKGKPGAGKSTLLKYAIQNIEQRSSFSESIVASFFFNARGSDIQKTTIGLFRSLLHQLSRQIPALLDRMTDVYGEKYTNKGEPGTSWQWHENELRDILRDFLQHASMIYRIRIYVDALDECGAKRAIDLVKYFKQLVSLPLPSEAAISICFSCRHYPIISFDFGLVVLVERENYKDIETYVQKELEDGSLDERKEQLLRTEIAQRAEGVFQWAILVVRRILELCMNGESRLETLLQKIRDIPAELDRLYQESLASIADEHRSRSLQLLQWICFAVRPLSLQELRFAMAVDAHTQYKSLSQCQQANGYIETDEDMERRVTALSKGLAEVKYHDGGRVVQFIHQSVNDYLISKGGLSILDKSASGNLVGLAHFRLSRSCIRYISMEEVGCAEVETYNSSALMKRATSFPFLSYSTAYWTQHVEEVEKHHVSQKDLPKIISDKIMRRWIGIYRERGLTDIGFHSQPWPTGTTLLHVAVRLNLLSVLPSALSLDDVDADAKDDEGQTPLALAAKEGHVAIVKVLLTWHDVKGKSDDVKIDINSKDGVGNTPLALAANRGHEAVVKLFLSREDVDVNIKGKLGKTPLHFAAEKGHKAVAELLLRRDDLDVNSIDDSWNGNTPLLLAASNGHEAVVKLLLTRDELNLNAEDQGGGYTPLCAAANNGYEKVVELLLAQKDIDVHSKTFSGRGPLHIAARNGHKAIAKLLLDRDELNSKDRHNFTPLCEAARQGHEEVVELLLARKDVDVNSKDQWGLGPLSQAVDEGFTAVVRLLLRRRDVDVNAKDYKGLTPLLTAVMNRREAAIRLLVNRPDIDLNSRDSTGRTPLACAVEIGPRGHTPLSIALNHQNWLVDILLMAWNDIDFEWENTARSSLMTVTARIFVSKAKGKGPINILEEDPSWPHKTKTKTPIFLSAAICLATGYKAQSSTTANNVVQPQTFAQFLAEEQAKDRASGRKPIAPSIRSELSQSHQRLLKRRTKLYFTALVLFQLSLVSTALAVVFTIQDDKSLQAWPLIWLIISAGLTLGAEIIAALLFKHRCDRRKALKRFADLEIEKYQREMQKSQKEAERASLHGRRIRDEYRSASRAGSLRSRSRASSRTRKGEDGGKGNFVSAQATEAKETYEMQAKEHSAVPPSAITNPQLPTEPQTLHGSKVSETAATEGSADRTAVAKAIANSKDQPRLTLDFGFPDFHRDSSTQTASDLPAPLTDSFNFRAPDGPLSSHPPSLFEVRGQGNEPNPGPPVPPKDSIRAAPPPPPPSRAPPMHPGTTIVDERIGLGLSLPTHPSNEALQALNSRLTTLRSDKPSDDRLSLTSSSPSSGTSTPDRAVSRSGHGLDREQSDENLRHALEKDSDVITIRSEDEGKQELIGAWARNVSRHSLEHTADGIDGGNGGGASHDAGLRSNRGGVSKGLKSWVSRAGRGGRRKPRVEHSGPPIDRTEGRMIKRSRSRGEGSRKDEDADDVIQIGRPRGRSTTRSVATANTSAVSPTFPSGDVEDGEAETRGRHFEGVVAYEGT